MRNDTIPQAPEAESLAIDLSAVDSVALRRLVAEVRQSERQGPFDATLYNRSYHRHNR